MSEKTISQKIARVFEIVDYFLLVPAIAGLLFGIMMIISGEAAIFGVGILTVFTIGTILLIGYFKHSRGTLSKAKTRNLWIGTIIFNGVFLAPSLYFVFLDTSATNSQHNLAETIFSSYGWLLVWWTIAVGGSIIALGYYDDQKYR
ncbi:MAG: hypothetical protein ABIP06_03110 [Pyrinomonadaceae bacterium]